LSEATKFMFDVEAVQLALPALHFGNFRAVIAGPYPRT
jgi:hypothetical protein